MKKPPKEFIHQGSGGNEVRKNGGIDWEGLTYTNVPLTHEMDIECVKYEYLGPLLSKLWSGGIGDPRGGGTDTLPSS